MRSVSLDATGFASADSAFRESRVVQGQRPVSRSDKMRPRCSHGSLIGILAIASRRQRHLATLPSTSFARTRAQPVCNYVWLRLFDPQATTAPYFSPQSLSATRDHWRSGGVTKDQTSSAENQRYCSANKLRQTADRITNKTTLWRSGGPVRNGVFLTRKITKQLRQRLRALAACTEYGVPRRFG